MSVLRELLEQLDKQKLFSIQTLLLEELPNDWGVKLGKGEDVLVVSCERLPGRVMIERLTHLDVRGFDEDDVINDINGYYADSDVIPDVKLHLSDEQRAELNSLGKTSDVDVTLWFKDVQDAFKALLLFTVGLRWRHVLMMLEPGYLNEVDNLIVKLQELKPA